MKPKDVRRTKLYRNMLRDPACSLDKRRLSKELRKCAHAERDDWRVDLQACALCSAFVWRGSPQGNKFWRDQQSAI